MNDFTLTPSSIFKQYMALTKPRVVMLITFCAVIGMFLSTPGWVPLGVLINATVGITLVAGAAAAVNCLVEQHIDAKMARTAWRPLPSGTLTPQQTLIFSGILGGIGTFLLYAFVNPLTTWLTLATFVGDVELINRLVTSPDRVPLKSVQQGQRQRRGNVVRVGNCRKCDVRINAKWLLAVDCLQTFVQIRHHHVNGRTRRHLVHRIIGHTAKRINGRGRTAIPCGQ
jgi:hypothetical protein